MSGSAARRDEETAALVAVLAVVARRQQRDRLARWRTDRRAALARTEEREQSR